MLLQLPPEIRQAIYHYTFVSPETTVKMKYSPRFARERSVLSALTTCKTIYAEAFDLFYRLNHLEFASPAALYSFLDTIHPRRRLEITALTVTGFGFHYTSVPSAIKAFNLLLLCPNLRVFHLVLSTDSPWDILVSRPTTHTYLSDWENFQIATNCLENLRGLKTASIRGIDPLRWRQWGMGPSDLEEVRCTRADSLRAAWLRPPRSGSTRFGRAARQTAICFAT